MSAGSSIPPSPILDAGTSIAERFRVERAIGQGSLGQVYVVLDDRSNKVTALRHIPGAVVRDAEDLERIREGVKSAAHLTHRNIVGTYGMGQEPSGDIFVTMEHVAGENLRTVLDRRLAAGKQFSLRGAFNIAAHVCNALEFAHAKGTIHGSVSPHHIMITKLGRVKLAGFPFSRILPTMRGVSSALRMYMMPYLAPELRDPRRKVDPRADVYSVGVVLFELLGGKPRPGIAPNAGALPESVPAGVRNALASALDPSPARRPATAAALRDAVAAALAAIGEIEEGDDDVAKDIEIDVDVASAMPPPTRASGAPPPPPRRTPAQADAVRSPGSPPPPPPGAALSTNTGEMPRAAIAGSSRSRPQGAPARGARVAADQDFRREDVRVSAPSIVAVAARPSVDFSAILNELDADDVERWLLQKDKLDHGPFRDRELAEMILRGAALGEHTVTNIETGKRAKIKQIEDFKPFIEKYRIRKKKEEEEAALKRSVRVERAGFAAKAGIALGIVGALAIVAVGLYFGLRGGSSGAAAVQEDLKVATAGPSNVEGIQDIEVEVLEKMRPPENAASQNASGGRGGGHGARRKRPSGPAGGMEDWDSAWKKGSELNFETDDSAPILTARDVNRALRSKQEALFRCLRGEMGRNSGLSGRVNIELLIRGNQIVAARAPGTSGAFENCLQSELSSVRFPAQAYGQMRSAFSMEVVR